MIEPLKAAIAEIERMPEDRQVEAAKVLNMFIDGRIRIAKLDTDESSKHGAAQRRLPD